MKWSKAEFQPVELGRVLFHANCHRFAITIDGCWHWLHSGSLAWLALTLLGSICKESSISRQGRHYGKSYLTNFNVTPVISLKEWLHDFVS